MSYGKRLPRPGIMERRPWFLTTTREAKGRKIKKRWSESLGSCFLLLFSIFPERLDWQTAVRGPWKAGRKEMNLWFLLRVFLLPRTLIPATQNQNQTYLNLLQGLSLYALHLPTPLFQCISKQMVLYIKNVSVKPNGLQGYIKIPTDTKPNKNERIYHVKFSGSVTWANLYHSGQITKLIQMFVKTRWQRYLMKKYISLIIILAFLSLQIFNLFTFIDYSIHIFYKYSENEITLGYTNCKKHNHHSPGNCNSLHSS